MGSFQTLSLKYTRYGRVFGSGWTAIQIQIRIQAETEFFVKFFEKKLKVLRYYLEKNFEK
jgi:hypothetical protein